VNSASSMPPEQAIELRSLVDQLETGDILLFSGRTLISRAIRMVTRSRWSHIGIIVRKAETGELFLWEATSSNTINDVDYGHVPRGVQLVRLEDKVRSYDGLVAVRRLIGVERTSEMLKRFGWLFKRLRRAPYRNYVVEYVKVGLGLSRRAPRYAFCSQLVAEAYVRMRLLRPEKRSALYVPKDFSPDRILPLRRGRLTTPIVVRA
jgi:hypothetical protein